MRTTASSMSSGQASIVRHDDPRPSAKPALDLGQAGQAVPSFGSILRKKAASGMKGWKPWIRRYFLLDESGIAWFSDEAQSADRRRATGRVPMHLLNSAEALPAKGPARFVLHVRMPRGGGQSLVHLEAESPALMSRWLGLISRHLAERSDGLCFAAASATPSPRGQVTVIDNAGSTSAYRPRATTHLPVSPGASATASTANASVAPLLAALPEADAPPPPPLPLHSTIVSTVAPSSVDSVVGDAVTQAEADAAAAAADAAMAALRALHSSTSLNDVSAQPSQQTARSRAVTAPPTPSPSKLAEALFATDNGPYIGAEVERRVLPLPGNDACADCITTDARKVANNPTWASTNLGVVFCIRCSGVHRRMGAHVSKVLSLQIDTWTHEQVAHMRTLGNAAVNGVLEASLPPGVKPDQAKCTPAQLEAFIRAKYELGSFKEGGDGRLPEVASAKQNAISARAMAEFCGLLIIRLLRATNLPNTDVLGKTDAFCEFTLGERKAKSKVFKNSLNPTWNQTLSLNVRNLNETLILKVYDKDFRSNEFIGQALVPLEDLTHDGQPIGFDLTLQLRKPNGRPNASVAVELTYNPLDR
jgi:stromal membrane-associated protein